MSQGIITYIGPYPLNESKKLVSELTQKVLGISYSNALYLIKLIGVPCEQLRTISYDKLSDQAKIKLQKYLTEGLAPSNSTFSNRKLSLISPLYAPQYLEPTSNNLILGENFISQIDLAKKRLISMKCYIGKRLKVGRKVHGQKTKCTGRKTKVMKGFQKKKLLKKLGDKQ